MRAEQFITSNNVAVNSENVLIVLHSNVLPPRSLTIVSYFIFYEQRKMCKMKVAHLKMIKCMHGHIGFYKSVIKCCAVVEVNFKI